MFSPNNPKNKTTSKLIAILGPTASGKSDLAVAVAKKFNGEIISADSRQVYKGMDIGTGKITKKEMQGIPHYLLDMASPKKRFSVAQYKKLALRAIKNIQRRGKLPIICGGTGFYIRAISDNLQIPEVKPDFKLRARLEKKTTQELFNRLRKSDPNRAATIDANNPRRLIRALEIVLKTNKAVPSLNSKSQFDTLFIGLKKSPAELKKLIHKRLLKRLKQGMIEEVRRLRASGLPWKRLDDFGLEYRWIAKYLRQLQNLSFRGPRSGTRNLPLASPSTSRSGRMRDDIRLRSLSANWRIGMTKKSLYDEMISRLQKDIEHYAKRQMTWFKKYPGKKIHWIKKSAEAQKIINNFIK